MSSTVIGSQNYSISRDGVGLLKQGKISTGIGGITIDLVSAPIPPGDYHLEIDAGMGGVEIYLPRWVEFTVDSHSVIGSKTVHDGLDFSKSITKKLQAMCHLPSGIPEAAAPAEGAQPVTIHFLINTGLGGIDIYKL